MNAFVAAIAIGAVLAVGTGLAFQAYPLDSASAGYASSPYVHLHDADTQQTRASG